MFSRICPSRRRPSHIRCPEKFLVNFSDSCIPLCPRNENIISAFASTLSSKEYRAICIVRGRYRMNKEL